jgi:hypothetical protein
VLSYVGLNLSGKVNKLYESKKWLLTKVDEKNFD